MSTTSKHHFEIAKCSEKLTPLLYPSSRRSWRSSVGPRLLSKQTIETHRQMPLCIYCGENFKDKWSLKLHCCTHHELNMPASAPSENHSDQRTPPSENKTFQSSNPERREDAVHLGKINDECPRREYGCLESSDLKSHVTAECFDQKPYKCPHCEYRAARSGRLKQHVQAVHIRQKPYKCPHCEYRAAGSVHLKQHVQAVHIRQKPYKRPHCEYRSAESGSLKKHVKAVHLGQKPYKCPHCEYRAAESGRLKKHVTAIHLKKSFDHTSKEESQVQAI